MSITTLTFDTPTTMEAVAPGGTVFSVDVETRTIRGRAVPYGVEGIKAGQRFMFSKGTVHPREGMTVKLWALHDKNLASGVVTEWNDTDEGLDVAFKVARGEQGDKALTLAEDGVWDSLSIGPSEGARFELRDGVHHAVSVPIHEISQTPAPVFGGARVTSVKFDAEQETDPMKCTKCNVVHPAGVTDCKPEDVTAFEAATAAAAGSTDADPIAAAIAAGFAALAPGGLGGPEHVGAGGPQRLDITEASPYRFDGVESEHDFSTDLIAVARDRDGEAQQRIMTFMAEAFTPATREAEAGFAVARTNVTSLNPARNRPDMYVDERRFATPLYDALHKGAINDQTPFLFPKFNSAAGLVADHTEGVEPTPGSFSATNQTVTPSPVSGKVEITREVWDQGGNPQVSGLIWRKIVQHYYTALENKALGILNTLPDNAGTSIALTTAAVNAALVSELEAAIVDLNFVAGGNTFDYAATHQNLYRRLAAAVDGQGRKLLPIIGPTNANGQARSKFASLDVAGTEFEPVPSLGPASNDNGNSYLVDSSEVHVWNSAPQRLEFQYRVAFIDLAVWGYCATAISDQAGVKRVKYDPTA